MSQTPATFEDLALRHGIITAEQLEECRVLRGRVAEVGLEVDLEEVLVKKGLVTKVQAMALHAALGRGNRHAIEGYELLGKLGRGGMGTVYRAKQLSMDRVVALKVLAPKLRKEKNEVDRFVREAKVIAQMNHPNIVAGIDAGHSNGIHYFAMEFVDGEALSQRIARDGAMPWKEALAIIRQTGAALEHAHQNGLVHRDVKPANIILGKDGSVKLADLGMARFAERHDLKVTQSGQVVGTPLYMSPEQARGEPVDIRADLYSLGITLYEMLSGAPPFTAKDPLVVLHKHLHDQVKFALPGVSTDVQTVGHRLTEKDRAKRYATPVELLRDVEILEKGGSLPQTRVTVRRSVRQQRVAAMRKSKKNAKLLVGGSIAAAAVIALVIAVAVGSSNGSPPPAPVVRQTPLPPRPLPVPASSVRPTGDPDPLTPKDQAVLSAYRAVRAYERNNPSDLEEIHMQYAELLPKAAGTLYEDRIRARTSESQNFLDAAIEIQKNEIGADLKRRVSRRDYSGALGSLTRRSQEFESPEWANWIAEQRQFIESAATQEAKGYRRASQLAESKQDFTGAIWAMEQMRTLGIPTITREAESRIERLVARREQIRAKEATARKQKEERERMEAADLDKFFTRAEHLAKERKYGTLEKGAPAPRLAKNRDLLKKQLEVFRAAHEVLAEARQYAIGRMGNLIMFEMRDGERVSGVVEAAQSSVLLVGGRTYDVNEMATASVVALYRTARAATARPEAIFAFALYEGDLTLAEETLRRSDLILPPRTASFLGALRKDVETKARIAREEKEAEALEAAAEIASLVDQPRLYAEIARKYPKTRAGAEARKTLRSIAPEIVVYAGDVSDQGFTGQFLRRDSSESPGGQMIAMNSGRDVFGPPPGNQHHVSFQVPVLAGVKYRCWVRTRTGTVFGGGETNTIYVQFSGAVDSTGKPLYPIGGAKALAMRGSSEAGWAWVGGTRSPAMAAPPVLTFPATGRVTIRIFGGNDNAGFDQFVLSPLKYFKSAPGDAVVAKP